MAYEWGRTEHKGTAVTESERQLDLLLGDALTENDKFRAANDHLVKATASALEEITALKKALKYQDDREGHIGTHSDECWAWGPRHYECALRRVAVLSGWTP